MAALLRLEIRQPGGQVDQLEIESDQVLIGSGAQCEVRLPPDVAAPEHLVVYARNGALFARASGPPGSVTLGRAPFVKGEIQSGSVFGIGRTLVHVTLLDRPDVAGRKPRSAIAYGLVLVLFAGLSFALFPRRKAEPVIAAPPNLPNLWPTGTVACPQTTREQAQRLASDLTALAESKRERAPFVPQAGVNAVILYREAASCTTVAGDKPAASRLTQLADTLGQEMIDAFKVSRLRLERAIVSKDWDIARLEARREKNFFGAQAADYVSWLNEVEKRSTIQLAKLPSKKKDMTAP